MSDRVALAVFVIAVASIGLAIGFATLPGPWYESLAKPAFNPPNWMFGPVWTLIYILIGIAGWRVWRVAVAGRAMRLWVIALVLNYLWSPVFFALHQIGLALAVILALLLAIVLFIAATWRLEPVAAWLFVPYAAWVAFATLLNAAIWRLN